MSDNSFFREVDEAVRHEQYKKLWDRYGIAVLLLVALLIIGVAGYRGWTFWQEQQAQEAGAEFTQALALQRGDEKEQARKAFESLAEDGPQGYQVLSRFQLAASEAASGETEKAVQSYDALATDGGVDPILQGLATLRAAALRLDSADYAEMERRLKGLIAGDSAWRFSARELLGLSAYRNNDLNAAKEQFSALLTMQGTPPNMRDRANMMLALIVSSPSSLGSDAPTN